METAFEDEAEIKRNYYPEVEEIRKTADPLSTGASEIFIFDHTIRRQPSDARPDTSPSLRVPIQRVHIDQLYTAGPQRVLHHLPTKAPRLLKSRYQVISVWRPSEMILKDPLGEADATSVPEEDLLPVQLIFLD